MLRRDYILRLIDQLGEFLLELTELRKTSRGPQALGLIAQAQEQLFGEASARIAERSPREQLDQLIRQERPGFAAAKTMTYVRLLLAAAECYRDRDNEAVALGAATLAGEVLVDLCQRYPDLARSIKAEDWTQAAAELRTFGIEPPEIPVAHA